MSNGKVLITRGAERRYVTAAFVGTWVRNGWTVAQDETPAPTQPVFEAQSSTAAVLEDHAANESSDVTDASELEESTSTHDQAETREN